MRDFYFAIFIVLRDSHELCDDFEDKEDCANVLQKENGFIFDGEFEGRKIHRHETRICDNKEHNTVEICDKPIFRVYEEVFLPVLLLFLLRFFFSLIVWF